MIVDTNNKQVYIKHMSEKMTINIRITRELADFARELSRKTPNCPRPKVGSVAHGLKWALVEQARLGGQELEIA